LTTYIPQGPLKLKRFNGQSIETMMIQNYETVLSLIEYLESVGGKSHTVLPHAKWLVEQGETRKSKVMCYFCKDKPIQNFLVIFIKATGEMRISIQDTCCDDDRCRERLMSSEQFHPHNLLPLRFSSIVKFPHTKHRKRVLELFRQVFGIKSANGQTLFQFFKDQEQ